MAPMPPKRLSALIMVIAALAVSVFSPPLQAQEGPQPGYVDLVMSHEYRDDNEEWVLYKVRNNGSATATGVDRFIFA